MEFCKNPANYPKIGDIYMMSFNGNGSEQHGYRPALVIQNNTGNAYSPNIIVLPLTTSIKKLGQPTHVFVSASDTGLLKDSIVLCENPECISKSKLDRYITSLPSEYMCKIAEAYLLATSVISFMPPEVISSVWKRANELNSVRV